jgi:hypothetical protein
MIRLLNMFRFVRVGVVNAHRWAAKSCGKAESVSQLNDHLFQFIMDEDNPYRSPQSSDSHYVPRTSTRPDRPVIVMPLYFIQSRGWATGLSACGLALAFVVVQFGIDFASSYLAIELFWGGD